MADVDLPADQAVVEAPEPRRRSRLRLLAWAAAALAALLLLAIIWLAITAPLSRSLKPYAPPILTLESADGTVIARKGAYILQPVRLSELPARVPQAFIAIEDRRFRQHWGIDPRGILRAAWNNLWAGGVREGGSTITQQLAKGAFLSADRTFGRKAQEVLIAFWLEAWLSKDEILERYLSNVYFGDNVYGLRAAARHYYSRDPEELTVGQAAVLAALLKAPSRLAPTSNPSDAWSRAGLVLDSMKREGFLSATERAAITQPRLRVTPVPEGIAGSYFSDWVLPEARERVGDGIGEQAVRTTLDSRIQRIAERAVRRAALGGAQAAVVVMRPDGAVVAMVGGTSYTKSPFNRATQARRPAGSTFKLFVYWAALREGMTPDDRVSDTPITTGPYRPTNLDGKYRGEISLLQAFARSSNVAAVRLTDQVGVKAVTRAARDLGVRSPLPSTPAIALGPSGMPLIELTQAYAAVAAGRYPVRARGLPDAEEQGRFGWLFGGQTTFDEDELAMLRDLLRSVVTRGTGTRAGLPVAAFGKTGTSQDNRDALFVGYAEDLVAGVWVGNDDNSPQPGLSGSGVPARIWREVMMGALRLSAPTAAAPERGNEADIDNITLPDIEAQIGNYSVAIGNDTIRLEGVEGLRIDIPVPPPAPAPAPAPVPAPPASPPGGQ